jgi:hypothetical protein
MGGPVDGEGLAQARRRRRAQTAAAINSEATTARTPNPAAMTAMVTAPGSRMRHPHFPVEYCVAGGVT